jgi:aminoglycoside 3-N-acetyltransferase
MPLPTVTRDDLLAGFRAVGIARGDIVYVASSLAALGMMPQPVADTLWALREAVGEEGTLVLPTFNFGFCKGEPFDRERTPSTTGVLTEAFRKLPEAVRTWSPPYQSVAAAGACAREIGAIVSPTSFGAGSVFQYLHDRGAKHLLVGCSYHEGMACFHWLEELYDVPYRYWKAFAGDVTVAGERQHRVFSMFVRRLDIDIRLDLDAVGQAFANAGHVRETTVGLCRLRAFGFRAFKSFGDARLAPDRLALLTAVSRRQFLAHPECPAGGPA